MTSRNFKFAVPVPTSRTRLEDALCDLLPSLSRMYLRSLIRDGKVEVNGRHENAGYKVRSGDFIEVEADMSRGTSMVAENIPLEVVFEDDEIIVVDKPAGMLVHPSHREKTGTLLNALTHHLNTSLAEPESPAFPAAGQERCGGSPADGRHSLSEVDRDFDGKAELFRSAIENCKIVRPGLVHRLDKDTSGLIVVAKTQEAHRVLARHFMKKRVEKRYAALVEGVVEADEGTIEAPIGRHADLKHWSVKEGGKHARTRFWVRERNADTTLLELEPVTGRTNQLRIHCESIGHAIVGDTRRGGRPFERLCLHASSLSFPHPSTNETMTFHSDCRFLLS